MVIEVFNDISVISPHCGHEIDFFLMETFFNGEFSGLEEIVKSLDDKVKEIFKEVMGNCKDTRKRLNDMSYKDLAKKLDKSLGYVEAFESGREFPSIKTFLAYLIVNGFDVEPLKDLSIGPRKAENRSELLAELLRKLKKMDDAQLLFMIEQTRIAEFIVSKALRFDPKK